MTKYRVLREGEQIQLIEIEPGDVPEAHAEEPDESRDQQPGGDGQMRVGWMWFDNDKGRSLEEKVQRAAERFRAKHGQWPELCYVNRFAAQGGNFICGKVRVVAAPNILPHHFWLGPLEKVA